MRSARAPAAPRTRRFAPARAGRSGAGNRHPSREPRPGPPSPGSGTASRRRVDGVVQDVGALAEGSFVRRGDPAHVGGAGRRRARDPGPTFAIGTWGSSRRGRRRSSRSTPFHSPATGRPKAWWKAFRWMRWGRTNRRPRPRRMPAEYGTGYLARIALTPTGNRDRRSRRFTASGHAGRGGHPHRPATDAGVRDRAPRRLRQ